MYDIPSATLEDTVAMIRKKLGLRGGFRSVGDPKASVRRVMLHPGLMTVATMCQYFRKPIFCSRAKSASGSVCRYAADMNTRRRKERLGHARSGRFRRSRHAPRANWLKS